MSATLIDGLGLTSQLLLQIAMRQEYVHVHHAAAPPILEDPEAAMQALADRGLLAPGLKADLNVIDLDRLRLSPPHMVNDLPANGQRLVQPVKGYLATVVGGEITYRNGTPTDAMPGRLVRGPQAA